VRETAWKALTMAACQNLTTNGATGVAWKTWNHNVSAPVCTKAGWGRVNHLGNGHNTRNQPLQYNWTLPAINKLGAYVQLKTAGASQVDARSE